MTWVIHRQCIRVFYSQRTPPPARRLFSLPSRQRPPYCPSTRRRSRPHLSNLKFPCTLWCPKQRTRLGRVVSVRRGQPRRTGCFGWRWRCTATRPKSGPRLPPACPDGQTRTVANAGFTHSILCCARAPGQRKKISCCEKASRAIRTSGARSQTGSRAEPMISVRSAGEKVWIPRSIDPTGPRQKTPGWWKSMRPMGHSGKRSLAFSRAGPGCTAETGGENWRGYCRSSKRASSPRLWTLCWSVKSSRHFKTLTLLSILPAVVHRRGQPRPFRMTCGVSRPLRPTVQRMNSATDWDRTDAVCLVAMLPSRLRLGSLTTWKHPMTVWTGSINPTGVPSRIAQSDTKTSMAYNTISRTPRVPPLTVTLLCSRTNPFRVLCPAVKRPIGPSVVFDIIYSTDTTKSQNLSHSIHFKPTRTLYKYALSLSLSCSYCTCHSVIL